MYLVVDNQLVAVKEVDIQDGLSNVCIHLIFPCKKGIIKLTSQLVNIMYKRKGLINTLPNIPARHATCNRRGEDPFSECMMGTAQILLCKILAATSHRESSGPACQLQYTFETKANRKYTEPSHMHVAGNIVILYNK